MARVKGLKNEYGKRHQVIIRDFSEEAAESDNFEFRDNPIWVGASSAGRPETGAYVSREKFLQAVATALNVAINEPHGAYYVP